ncbi:MAG: hypothetical protein LBG71_04555 [Clostridiales Family XIII bacterium]|jgi:hypothetical protein|nr:hypothetical protein [Clostridiales Family XIII bacterium]
MVMKRDDNQIDRLLRSALASDETPAPKLAEKAKHPCLSGERPAARATARRRVGMAAVVAVALALTATTALAAWNLLKPGEAVSVIGPNPALRAAFESDGAININKSAESGGYIFTLLAVVSGDGLSDMPYYVDGEIARDRTYAVMAVQNADGAPMEIDPYFETFLATPLIKGMEPWRFNIVTMNGGKSGFVSDGALYLVVECDNVTAFADRGLYFAVCDSVFINNETFSFDEETGEIGVNPNYGGASAVFELPVSKSLADPEKAAKWLEDNQIGGIGVKGPDEGFIWIDGDLSGYYQLQESSPQ